MSEDKKGTKAPEVKAPSKFAKVELEASATRTIYGSKAVPSAVKKLASELATDYRNGEANAIPVSEVANVSQFRTVLKEQFLLVTTVASIGETKMLAIVRDYTQPWEGSDEDERQSQLASMARGGTIRASAWELLKKLDAKTHATILPERRKN